LHAILLLSPPINHRRRGGACTPRPASAARPHAWPFNHVPRHLDGLPHAAGQDAVGPLVGDVVELAVQLAHGDRLGVEHPGADLRAAARAFGKAGSAGPGRVEWRRAAFNH
jgi:hypothetical protein